MRHAIAPILMLSLLASCSKPAEPPAPAAAPEAAAPVAAIKAPAGTYTLDPYHSSLSFAISHMGLAPYVARFTRMEATLELVPTDLSASKVSVTIDPLSVRTDYSGDFQATHKDSPYTSFDERLGREDKFFNGDQHPQISFQSTRVRPVGDNRLEVAGDLTFLGQTRPVTLDVTVTGSLEQHPFTKAGAIGFTATHNLDRIAFGMKSMPGILGDTVRIEFNGEFHQQVAPPAG